ncbi:MAG: hypothetical protein WAT46_05290, partial [Saprospiraceae bacterium]
IISSSSSMVNGRFVMTFVHFNNDAKVKVVCAIFLRSGKIFFIFLAELVPLQRYLSDFADEN